MVWTYCLCEKVFPRYKLVLRDLLSLICRLFEDNVFLNIPEFPLSPRIKPSTGLHWSIYTQPDRCTAQSPLWIATPGQIGLSTGDGDWSPNLAEPIGLDWSLHRWIATTRWRLSKIEIRFTILYFRNRMNNNQLTYISLSPPFSPLSLSPSHTHTHTLHTCLDIL